MSDKVAMMYRQPIRKMVTIHGHDYVFTPQHNVSLAYVELDDVAALEAFREGCCGGKMRGFIRASEANIRLWNGAER